MIKTWKGRLAETLAIIETEEKNQQGNGSITQAIKDFVARMSDAQRKELSESMAQGKYAKGVPQGVEQVNRKYRRALILIYAVRCGLGVTEAIQYAKREVARFGDVQDLSNRVRQELKDHAQRLTSIRNQLGQPATWAGWDVTKYRPLLAGAAIGRRGAHGPGTLGCFVRKNGHIYILSNHHVLQQKGSSDKEIIQPAHEVGGSYTDVVAIYEDGEPTLDAAIARVVAGIRVDNRTPGGAGFVIQGKSDSVRDGMAVKKAGACTGKRYGNIISATTITFPRWDLGRNVVTTHQIRVERDD